MHDQSVKPMWIDFRGTWLRKLVRKTSFHELAITGRFVILSKKAKADES